MKTEPKQAAKRREEKTTMKDENRTKATIYIYKPLN
jgi:hypothetical protein